MLKNVTNSFLLSVFGSLDTPGGHIAICLCLLFVYGRDATPTGISHDIAIFAIGVLARSMGVGVRSDYAVPVANAITTTTKTETETEEISK